MRISKTIIVLLTAFQLFGQTKYIIIDEIDTLAVTTFNDAEYSLDSLLKQSNSLGQYFELDKILSDSSVIYNRNSNKIVIDTLIYVNLDVRTSILNQIFNPLNGTIPTIESKELFNIIKRNTPFIGGESYLQFAQFNVGKLGALVNIESRFNSYFSGLVGASRSKKQEWEISGQMDIHLENQWRTAGIVDLHWKRLDEESQQINLLYEEPHPLGLPLGFNAQFNQDLRSGNYVNTNSSLGIVKMVPGIGKIGFGGKTTKINSTAKGDSLGLTNLSMQSMYLSSITDYRNDYWLATKGHFISINAEVGKRSIIDTKSSSISLRTTLEKYIPISNKINVKTKVFGSGNWVSSGNLHNGELIRFGGANNLRGYLEDNLMSGLVVIPSLELNVNLSSNQQITLFTDIALQEEYSPLPFGFGFGFIQVTNNSVLKLFYGLGRDDTFKNGKVHLQYFTRL